MNEKIDSPIRLRNRNVPRYLPIPKNYLGTFSNEIRRQGDEQDHEEMLYKSTPDKDKGAKALIPCDSFDLESSKELNIYNDLAFNFRKLIVNYSSSDSDGIDDADNLTTTVTKTFYNINELVDSSDEESVVENEGHNSSEQKIIFSKTTKDKALLICGDHQYIFEKKHESRMYWRCNYESYKKGKKHCKQRLRTDLDCKPLKLTKTVHNHDSDDPEDMENILVINRIKERSKQTIENPRTIINDALSNLSSSSAHLIASKENLTQQISRVRRRQNGLSKSNPKKRMEISIPVQLRKTNSDSDFVLFDSVVVHRWNYMGVIYQFFMPFWLIKLKKFIQDYLNLLNLEANISDCLFHLVSNLYKHVQSNGLVTAYKSRTDNRFRKCFKYLSYLRKMLSMFYIGKQLYNDASKRTVPLNSIKYWNVHKRILKDLPRTNNNIEA
ncbi:hypothetical protein BpHYR1_040038 [Brachionus plicatilis]|uniref:FLYWCH-type domain-containing protein n=1 Tax=Brachionus plicatilis TaxID=10195 RepID=A0A3M7R5J3_BRAPC|nr:hypothetical protein BpHYR1_040038 [Brachionus plicatilis]